MPVVAHKIQGFKSQFSFTPLGGASTQAKALAEWSLDIKGEALDGSDHDSAGWKDYLTGMLDWDGTLKQVYVVGDASQVALFSAIANQTVCAGVFFPEKLTGQMSYTGPFTITGYKHGGTTNNGVQTLDITIKCAGALTQTAQA